MAINPLQIPTYAAPQQADFTSLANLGTIYRASQNQQRLSDLGKGLADGSVDYRTAAGQIAETGNIDAVYKFLQLDEAKKKQILENQASKDFMASVAPYLGGRGDAQPSSTPATGGPAAAPQASSPLPGPVTAPGAVPAPLPFSSRAPVASSSKVWGDDEAVAVGLYEPKPGQPKPQTMSLASLGNPPAMPMPTPSGPSQTTSGLSGQTPQPQAIAQAGPSPYPAEANTQQQGLRIPPASVLIGGMLNPNTPAPQKELAGKLFTRLLDDSKPDEKVKHLQELARVSGFQGTPLELEMQLRRASKTDVTTNIDSKTESEENKAAGKAAGERRATMFSAAGAAGRTLQNLSRTESLLDQVSQGKLEPAKMSISAWAKALGVNDDVATSLGLDPKGVGSAQALQSLANESVLSKIGSGGFPANNFSNSDREFLVDMFPKLGNDPRGNKIMVEGARRIAQLDMQRARDYQQFKADPANKGKGFEDFELSFSEKVSKQDMFGDLRKQAEAIVGGPRTEVGRTLSNPGSAPQQPGRQQAAPQVQGAKQAPDGNYYVPDPQRPGKYLQVQ